MLKLTKFTGEEIYVNPEMVKSIEPGGDTVVTLVTGDRLLVKEEVEVICERFLQYKKETGNFVPEVAMT